MPKLKAITVCQPEGLSRIARVSGVEQRGVTATTGPSLGIGKSAF
jgi:hypothetical protein